MELPPFCWGILILIVAIILGKAYLKAKVKIAMINKMDWHGLISFLQTTIWILGAVITIALVLDGVPGDELVSVIGTLGLNGFFQVIKPKKKKEIED